MLLTDKSNVGSAGPAAFAAGRGWLVGCGCLVFFSVMPLFRGSSASVLEGGDVVTNNLPPDVSGCVFEKKLWKELALSALPALQPLRDWDWNRCML